MDHPTSAEPAERETEGPDGPDRRALGHRVRALRKRAGLTLEAASAASGVSRAAISKIERGEISPTYDSLCRLARGMDVDLGVLVTGTEPRAAGYAVTRAGAGAPHETPRFAHSLLAPDFAARALYAFETEVRATSLADYGDWDRHDSEDLLYVLSGTLTVHLEGEDPIKLGPGDALQMDGAIAHALLGPPGDPAPRVLWVSTGRESR